MAQNGYTPIQLYYSSSASVAPTAGNLAYGELAINILDGKLYYKDSGNSVQLLASKSGASGDVVGPSSSTANAVALFDGTTGKLLQSSASLLPSGAIVGISDSQTLTNKTISGSSNTLSNIANASLTNSSVTINGSSVSLGGSTTVTATATNALTIGTGLSGTSYNGSTAITIAINSTVATLTGTQTLTNKTISGVSNTLSNIGNSSLTNSSVTVNGSSISLGGSATVTANTTNALTIGTGLSGTSFNGNSAVTIAIDSTVATLTGTQTLTNKRIDPRVSSTTSTGTLTPDISSFDQYCLTAQAAALTVAAPTGTPVNGDKLIIRILDNATSQTISWNATYTVIGVTLPTSTTISKMLYVGCIYNAANTRWDVVAVTTQA